MEEVLVADGPRDGRCRLARRPQRRIGRKLAAVGRLGGRGCAPAAVLCGSVAASIRLMRRTSSVKFSQAMAY